MSPGALNRGRPRERQPDGFFDRTGFGERIAIGIGRQRYVGRKETSVGRGGARPEMDGEQSRHVTRFQFFQLQLGKLCGGTGDFNGRKNRVSMGVRPVWELEQEPGRVSNAFRPEF